MKEIKDFEIVSEIVDKENNGSQIINFSFIINRNNRFDFQISVEEIDKIYDFAHAVINGKSFIYTNEDLELTLLINKENINLISKSSISVYNNNHILRNAFRRFHEEKNNWEIIEKEEENEEKEKEKEKENEEKEKEKENEEKENEVEENTYDLDIEDDQPYGKNDLVWHSLSNEEKRKKLDKDLDNYFLENKIKITQQKLFKILYIRKYFNLLKEIEDNNSNATPDSLPDLISDDENIEDFEVIEITEDKIDFKIGHKLLKKIEREIENRQNFQEILQLIQNYSENYYNMFLKSISYHQFVYSKLRMYRVCGWIVNIENFLLNYYTLNENFKKEVNIEIERLRNLRNYVISEIKKSEDVLNNFSKYPISFQEFIVYKLIMNVCFEYKLKNHNYNNLILKKFTNIPNLSVLEILEIYTEITRIRNYFLKNVDPNDDEMCLFIEISIIEDFIEEFLDDDIYTCRECYQTGLCKDIKKLNEKYYCQSCYAKIISKKLIKDVKNNIRVYTNICGKNTENGIVYKVFFNNSWSAWRAKIKSVFCKKCGNYLVTLNSDYPHHIYCSCINRYENNWENKIKLEKVQENCKYCIEFYCNRNLVLCCKCDCEKCKTFLCIKCPLYTEFQPIKRNLNNIVDNKEYTYFMCQCEKEVKQPIITCANCDAIICSKCSNKEKSLEFNELNISFCKSCYKKLEKIEEKEAFLEKIQKVIDKFNFEKDIDTKIIITYKEKIIIRFYKNEKYIGEYFFECLEQLTKHFYYYLISDKLPYHQGYWYSHKLDMFISNDIEYVPYLDLLTKISKNNELNKLNKIFLPEYSDQLILNLQDYHNNFTEQKESGMIVYSPRLVSNYLNKNIISSKCKYPLKFYKDLNILTYKNKHFLQNSDFELEYLNKITNIRQLRYYTILYIENNEIEKYIFKLSYDQNLEKIVKSYNSFIQ